MVGVEGGEESMKLIVCYSVAPLIRLRIYENGRASRMLPENLEYICSEYICLTGEMEKAMFGAV